MVSAPNGYSLFASKVETLFRMNSIESTMTIASTRIIDSSEEGVFGKEHSYILIKNILTKYARFLVVCLVLTLVVLGCYWSLGIEIGPSTREARVWADKQKPSTVSSAQLCY